MFYDKGGPPSDKEQEILDKQSEFFSKRYANLSQSKKKVSPMEESIRDIVEKYKSYENDPRFKGMKELVGHLSKPTLTGIDKSTLEDLQKFFPNNTVINEKEQKWHERWFNRAREVSLWSKDPSTKVGAVFVNEETHRELSAGYNGFPRGVKDDERLNNREMKYKLVVHAEQNGIYNAVNNGVILNGCSMYLWGLPVCSDCAKGIIQVGVKKVYVKKIFVEAERWSESWGTTQRMFEEAGVQIIIK